VEPSKGRECFCGCGRRLHLIDRRKRFNRAGRRVDSELESLTDIYEVMEAGGESGSEVGMELQSFLDDGATFRRDLKLVVHRERKPGRAERRQVREWTRLVVEHSRRVRDAIVRAAGDSGAPREDRAG
jgi:hypothetical protein